MKKIIPLIGFILYLTTSPTWAVVTVLACEPEWKALVEALGGERVKVSSATTAFQDAHFIEARPSLIAKARRADLVICTGAELEVGWLPLLIRKSGNAGIQVNEPGYFLAAEQVERLEIPDTLDRSHGDLHASGNPHVHWDPYRLLAIAHALSNRLQALDTEHAKHYQKHYDQFKTDWETRISQWETQAAALKGQSVIVYHKNWSYLLSWLGLETAGDLEPKPGIPPTAKHLAHLRDTTQSNEVSYILTASYQDDKAAHWLSDKTDIPVLNLPFTVGGSQKAHDLISLYDEVISALTENL